MKKALVVIALLAVSPGCTVLTIRHGEDQATWRNLELFRSRNTHIEYDPVQKVFKADIERTDTLTPDKVEALSRGVAAGIRPGF